MLTRSALTLAVLSIAPGVAAELEDFRLLVTSSSSGLAVVARGSGELSVVGPGDTLPGAGATVLAVFPDRLEVEARRPESAEGPAGPPRRLWLFRAEAPGRPSRIVILDREAPPSPARLAPIPPAPPPHPGEPLREIRR
ncbi:MAG TPA: hypothetical protein VM599_03250 [Thermoanaerobaculia bacterium]|nr:hypothetical protein [Thermoanaerobaculia bacterium]